MQNTHHHPRAWLQILLDLPDDRLTAFVLALNCDDVARDHLLSCVASRWSERIPSAAEIWDALLEVRPALAAPLN